MAGDSLRTRTLLLTGDVMLGRGIDQLLPNPGDPRLIERYVDDARYYVRAAGSQNGRIRPPLPVTWPWGDALAAIDAAEPDARVINLETAITHDGRFAPGKEVHYRMCPDNIAVLRVARPDVCVLANNHVLDFGPAGLTDTVDALTGAGIATAGAGQDATAASRPVVIPLGADHRLIVLAAADESSGVPPQWTATEHGPGVRLLPDLSAATAETITAEVAELKRPGDVVLFSVHWGSNWGYNVPRQQIRFAHHLADGGVDIVHGHSSHNPRPLDVYHDRLILYGCGDLINDYEGITGYEEYRGDLRLLYFPSVDPDTGRLTGLRLVPLRSRRLRLIRTTTAESAWLADTLTRFSGRLAR